MCENGIPPHSQRLNSGGVFLFGELGEIHHLCGRHLQGLIQLSLDVVPAKIIRCVCEKVKVQACMRDVIEQCLWDETALIHYESLQ